MLVTRSPPRARPTPIVLCRVALVCAKETSPACSLGSLVTTFHRCACFQTNHHSHRNVAQSANRTHHLAICHWEGVFLDRRPAQGEVGEFCRNAGKSKCWCRAAGFEFHRPILKLLIFEPGVDGETQLLGGR